MVHTLVCVVRFLKLYGLRFSKEDHVLFVRLLYELVTLPHLEPHVMQSFARLLIQLLKWVNTTHAHTHAHTRRHACTHTNEYTCMHACTHTGFIHREANGGHVDTCTHKHERTQ